MRNHQSDWPEALALVASLHEIGIQGILDHQPEPFLDAWLHAALGVMNTEVACVHVVDDVDGKSLRLIAHRTVGSNVVLLREPKAESIALLRTVIERRQRITFDETTTVPGCSTIARTAIYEAEALALQMTPVYARNGGPLAVLSIFFPTSRRPTEAQLQLIDLCCRQAAGFLEIERSRKAEYGRRARSRQATHGRPVEDDHVEQSRRRWNQSVATLAHEVRQPVAAALQAIELGKLSDRSEDQERAADIVERQLRHIARLVDDLSAISRDTETALPSVRRERLDLREPLEEALQTTSALFEAKQHERRVDLPAAPVMVSADVTRMKQLFTNLLQNAASYTPDGGRIVVSLTRDDDSVRLRVRDNGIGVRSEALGQIFEAFVRNNADGDSSHLGMGLALVRQIAEAHGGSAVAHSDGEGAGTEFVISLPADRADGKIAPAGSPRGLPFPVTADGSEDLRHDRLIL
jgi:signal transduction histidine kinase